MMSWGSWTPATSSASAFDTPAVVLMKPQGTTAAGCPVKLVMVKLALLGAGETNTSHLLIKSSILPISSVRARCARRYSTAGIKREVRKEFGQSWGDCPDS